MQHFAKQALLFHSFFQEVGTSQVQQVVILQPVKPRGVVTSRGEGYSQLPLLKFWLESYFTQPVLTPQPGQGLQPFQAVGKQWSKGTGCVRYIKNPSMFWSFPGWCETIFWNAVLETILWCAAAERALPITLAMGRSLPKRHRQKEITLRVVRRGQHGLSQPGHWVCRTLGSLSLRAMAEILRMGYSTYSCVMQAEDGRRSRAHLLFSCKYTRRQQMKGENCSPINVCNHTLMKWFFKP